MEGQVPGPETVNVGLIGGGGIARLHAIAYAAAPTYFAPDLPPVRLRRVADVDPAVARSAAERLRFEEWTTDWEALVASPDIDLVSIATPNFLHAPMAIAAAAAGKHVFCEKPLSNTAADAERMCRAAEAAGIVHGVNFNYRKVPAVQFIHRLIRAGRLGSIRHFRAVFLQDWGSDPGIPRSWKFEASRSGGGSVIGVGSHLVDLARFLVGELDRLVATTEIWVKERPLPVTARPFEAVTETVAMAPVEVDDSAYFLARFVGGAIGAFEVSRCAPGRKNQLALEIHGSLGSVCFDYERPNEVRLYLADADAEAAGFRTVVIGPAQDPASLVPFAGFGVGFMESILFQVRDLLAAIGGGPPMSPSFHDGWRAQLVVESALESAQKGWVTLPPLPEAGVTPAAPRHRA
jgi:predicted dehydrogenase